MTTYGSMTKLSRKVSWLKLVVTLVFCVILLEIMFNCKTSIFTTGKPGKNHPSDILWGGGGAWWCHGSQTCLTLLNTSVQIPVPDLSGKFGRYWVGTLKMQDLHKSAYMAFDMLSTNDYDMVCNVLKAPLNHKPSQSNKTRLGC